MVVFTLRVRRSVRNISHRSSSRRPIPRLVLRLATLSSFVVSTAIAPLAKADVLFEGYSKVMLADTHIGYVVQRFEFDPKKQEFSTAYYLKTNQTGGNITESLKARATASLKPLSYQYTELSGDKARTIDATFKGDQMTAIVKDGGKQQTISKKIPSGAFLVSFIVYLMLQGKEGIKAGAKYGYQAIAEEDGNVYAGEAFISAEEPVSGMKAFKVLNTFKGSRFISFVTHKGEVISTRSPVQNISTVLVPTMQEATAGMSFTPANLTLLFGSIPKGVENSIARKAGATPGAEGKDAAPGKGTTTLEAGKAAQDGKAAPSSKAPGAKASDGAKAAPETSTPTEASTASAAKMKTLSATPAPVEESAKKEGVPAGQGVQIKVAPGAKTGK